MKSLTVLLIARTNVRKKRTGMGEAATNITSLLKQAGCTVIQEHAPNMTWLTTKHTGIDIIWFYEDTCLDFDNILKLSELYNNDVPIIVNSMVTHTPTRRKVLTSFIETLKTKGLTNILLGMFTEEIRNSFGEDKKYTAALPKTIREMSIIPKPYDNRKGIMLGEFNKMLNPNLTQSFVAYDVVKQLRINFPDIPLFAYRHYLFPEGHRFSIPRVNRINSPEELKYIEDNVKIIEYTPDLIEMFNDMLIYISTVDKETFAMVPTEAQATGMYVMYKDMPQSLSPYLYYSGYAWETVPDLINAVSLVYPNKGVWEGLSRNSIHNYLCNNVKDLQYSLRLQLEKYVVNYRRNK